MSKFFTAKHNFNLCLKVHFKVLDVSIFFLFVLQDFQ